MPNQRTHVSVSSGDGSRPHAVGARLCASPSHWCSGFDSHLPFRLGAPASNRGQHPALRVQTPVGCWRFLEAGHLSLRSDMTMLWTLVVVLLLLVTIGVIRPAKTTILEYERGLKFSRGRFKGILAPGEYWHVGFLTLIQRLDVRQARAVVAGQEVLSADGVAVKASMVAAFHVADAERAVLGTDNFQMAIHTELQLALRSIASNAPIEELLRSRAEISVQLKEIAAPRLRAIGIELEDASLRDLTFPGDLKKIFTQVVKARQEGLAALEKARGETAALRNLANAAALIERSPSLMQLRALQVLAQQPGNTLVLGMNPGTTTIPLRDRQEPEPPAPREITPGTE